VCENSYSMALAEKLTHGRGLALNLN